MTSYELDLLKQCIINNPRDTLYCSNEKSNILHIDNSEAMQCEFINKISFISEMPAQLSLDDYTNLRLYVTAEFLGSGWNREKEEPNEYGIELDRLLCKLSNIVDKLN